jgi:CBS domain-containing protein
MICPSCGFENIEGEDECANCGADLRTADTPHPGSDFEARLVGERLAALSPPAPATIDPSATADEAAAQMRRDHVEALVVDDGQRLVGILTERDLLMKLAGHGDGQLRVADVMTPDPVVLRGDDTMAVALHKMALGGFRHIPIVADGRARGIVSARDIFRHILDVLGAPTA